MEWRRLFSIQEPFLKWVSGASNSRQGAAKSKSQGLVYAEASRQEMQNQDEGIMAVFEKTRSTQSSRSNHQSGYDEKGQQKDPGKGRQ